MTSAVTYILTDIEGTTSDIRFVKEVLFPYASEHLPNYIRQYKHLPEVAPHLQVIADDLGCPFDDLESISSGLLAWIDADLKKTALKALQGQVWRHGYQRGDFTGHLYEDAYTYLKAWSKAGLTLGVYSSGSVEAQHLLFAHTDFGDLTVLFSDYFDTHVGHKREVQAYQTIAQSLISLNKINTSSEVLFLSDIVEELDAAKEAGMQTAELRRDQQDSTGRHPRYENFHQIDTQFLKRAP